MILEERGVGFLLEKTLLILTDFGDFNKYLKNVGGKKVIRKANVWCMCLKDLPTESSLIFVPQGSTKLRGYFIFLTKKKVEDIYIYIYIEGEREKEISRLRYST